MWQKIKDQLPAILVTVILLGLVLGAYVSIKVIPDLNAARQREIIDLKQQHSTELQASAEQTRRQIEAVNTLLRDAIAKHSADALMTDAEFAKTNEAKVNQLAEAIAQKIQPFNPLPKTPEEAERLQNEQVDKVSSRLSEKIQPILADIAKDQNLTRESLATYSQRIADQVGSVLTAELAKNQLLNNNLVQAHSVAEQSLALSHETVALYLSSLNEQGVLTRILSLPANVIRDISNLSIVTSNERKKKEQELVNKMNAIQKQLDDIQAASPKK